MKIYYYKYVFTYPNLKTENREYLTSNVTEFINAIKRNKDKWYIDDEEFLVFENGRKVNKENILNPF